MNTTRSLKIEMSFFFQESLFAYFFCWRFVCFFLATKNVVSSMTIKRYAHEHTLMGKKSLVFLKEQKKEGQVNQSLVSSDDLFVIFIITVVCTPTKINR